MPNVFCNQDGCLYCSEDGLCNNEDIEIVDLECTHFVPRTTNDYETEFEQWIGQEYYKGFGKNKQKSYSEHLTLHTR